MARSDALDGYFSESLCLPIDPDGFGRHILGVRHGAISREDVVGGDMYEEDVSLLADFCQSCYRQVIDFIRLIGLIFGSVNGCVCRCIDDDFYLFTDCKQLDGSGFGEVKRSTRGEVIAVCRALRYVGDTATELTRGSEDEDVHRSRTVL